MLYKTRGIVLHSMKYRETSVIVKIFTEELGLKSYIVNNVRTKNRSSIALYQLFTILDLVVYNKEGSSLNRIKEVNVLKPLHSIAHNFKKNSIVIFLAEVLCKTLQPELKDRNLFKFLLNSIRVLEDKNSQIENFHIKFLFILTHHLGFEPLSINDMLYQIGETIDQSLMPDLNEFIHQTSYEQSIDLSASQRSNILNNLVKYYKLHITSLQSINSLTILKELFV